MLAVLQTGCNKLPLAVSVTKILMHSGITKISVRYIENNKDISGNNKVIGDIQ